MLKKLFCVVLLTISLSTITMIIIIYRKDISEFTEVHRSKSNHSMVQSRQYLWCVNHYGPNNQMRDFIKCCIIARLNNYTIVIPPFFPHYGRRRTQNIQWFDQFYDLKQLNKVVDLITIDQFVSQMTNSSKKLMLDCYMRQIELINNRMWYPQNTLISIERTYKIKINFHRQLNLSKHLNINEIALKSKNCSSIFLHIHYTVFAQFFQNPDAHTRTIFEHIHRTPLIQRLALQLINSLPELLPNKTSSEKKFYTLAVIHMRLGDYTVMNVSMYIQQILLLINNKIHFTHLHIMCPYLNSTHVKQLTEKLPVPFTISQYLLNHVRFVLDDYIFDVLEQEIAYQAPIFLASPWTTYSATILMQKVLHNKGVVYILSRNMKQPPILVTKKNVRYFQ
ncbi:hypothetical protein I4U23_014782 [Adineta vaga]|nr:hypothetical protein I4U23_014782 [Adineta vaga]